MLARDICRHASLEAKGGSGMVALAGEKLNLVLQDLKLNRDLKVNRVTATLNLPGGTNGPFNLPTDYLRTYDLFYQLQGPNGSTQFLTPLTMEQYDAEFKGTQASNYPYEFATDLSTQAIAATTVTVPNGGVASVTVLQAGGNYSAAPTVIFTGSGSGAAAQAHLGILAAQSFPGNTGAGYAVGDTLTVVGGAGLRSCRLAVLSVVGAGALAVLGVIDGGDYTTLPCTQVITAAVSGGSGIGGTVALTFLATNPVGVSSVVVTAPGSYTSAPTVTFAGGGGTNTLATATLSAGTVTPGKGQLYIYPQSNGALALTHRYMRDQPDIVAPEASGETPWFPYDAYLIKATAAAMMGITGDERQAQYLKEAEEMLRPHLIMEGDEQGTVRSIRLDPRHFKSNRGLRPTKVNPY